MYRWSLDISLLGMKLFQEGGKHVDLEMQNRVQEGCFWLLAKSHIGRTNPTENVSFATANDTNSSTSNCVEIVNT